MELVWLIVQALVLCSALFAVTCGLALAPWYVLLAALGIVLVAIQQLMPELRGGATEPVPPVVEVNAAIVQTNSSPEVHPGSRELWVATSHSPHLSYRGVDYVPDDMKPLATDSPSPHLSYRGVDYVPDDTKRLPTNAHSPHLSYRGVDYGSSHDKEPSI